MHGISRKPFNDAAKKIKSQLQHSSRMADFPAYKPAEPHASYWLDNDSKFHSVWLHANSQ